MLAGLVHTGMMRAARSFSTGEPVRFRTSSWTVSRLMSPSVKPLMRPPKSTSVTDTAHMWQISALFRRRSELVTDAVLQAPCASSEPCKTERGRVAAQADQTAQEVRSHAYGRSPQTCSGPDREASNGTRWGMEGGGASGTKVTCDIRYVRRLGVDVGDMHSGGELVPCG